MLATRMRTVASNVPLIDILTSLGLTTDLELVLDAGDGASYTSGQSWLDRSGNGFDYFRGVDGSAASDDPTFNGTAGGLSLNEYWSFDGADFFQYDSANETWMNNLHKNSVLFSMACWFYADNLTLGSGLFGTGRVNTEIGIQSSVQATSGKIEIQQYKGSAPTGLSFSSDTVVVTENAWNFIELVVDEASGGTASWMGVNGDRFTFDGTYLSPSASNATNIMQIGSRSDALNPVANTNRLAMFVMWEGSVRTTVELDSLRAATRGRFNV